MVSSSRSRPKKSFDSQALLSFLSWIKILCSGCFGRVVHFKRPHGQLTEGKLKSSVAGKTRRADLRVKTLRKGMERDGISASEAFAWESPRGGSPDVWDSEQDDDDEDMFEGRFYIGTRVLTEVEMRSPVEESKGIATIVKAPRINTQSVQSTTSSPLSDASHTGDQSKPCQSSSSAGTVPAKVDAISSSSTVMPLKMASSCAQTGEIDAIGTSEDQIVTISDALCGQSNIIADQSAAIPTTGGGLNATLAREIQELRDTVYPETEIRVSLVGQQEKPHGEASAKTNSNSKPIDIVNVRTTKFNFQLEEKAGVKVGSLPDCKSPLRKSTPNSGRSRPRTRSLTDNDFAELKGCIDLGFVFTQDDVPDLRDTLPALEVCYAIAQGAISPVSNSEDSASVSPGSPTISPWKIASPGDQPQQVKTRLRHWAQAVACSLRQSS